MLPVCLTMFEHGTHRIDGLSQQWLNLSHRFSLSSVNTLTGWHSTVQENEREERREKIHG
jgi:hypothetical protein